MNRKHYNDHTLSPDFEKVFLSVNSSMHADHLSCCTKMIDNFKLRHPGDEALAFMLHGMLIMRLRILQDRDKAYQPLQRPYLTRVIKEIASPHTLQYN